MMTDGKQIELKLCPFCGGKAERIDIDEGENAGGSCICCTVCQSSSNVEFGFKENFVSNWNRRAAATGLIEALEKIIRENQIREFMGDDASDGYGNEGWVVRDGQYAKIARAAIAKAEGK